jgi:hypothetical protein
LPRELSSDICGSIIDHTRYLLSQVRTWAVQHVAREFNAAAYKLARFAINQRQHTQFGGIPFLFSLNQMY